MPRFVARSLGTISAYSSAVARLAAHNDVRGCVGALTVDHLNPMCGAGTIKAMATCRLDRQPGPANPGAANLQVQVNAAAGVRPGQGTTIGQVLVPAIAFLAAEQAGPARTHLQRELLNLTRSTLVKSASGSGAAYVIDVQA